MSKATLAGIGSLGVLVATSAYAQRPPNPGPPVRPGPPVVTQAVVDCAAGESIAEALARVARVGPSTISILGRCDEAVVVEGFMNLTLRGEPGAVLAGSPAPELSVLEVVGSTNVRIENLNIDASQADGGIAVRSTARCVLRSVVVLNPRNWGVLVARGSSLEATDITMTGVGVQGVGIWDKAYVVLERSTIEGAGWAGLAVGRGSVAQVAGTNIRGFWVGVSVQDAAHADLAFYASENRPVVIEQCSQGAWVTGASVITLEGPVRLTGLGAPQNWGQGLHIEASVLTISSLVQMGELSITGYTDGVWLGDNATGAFYGFADLSDNGNGFTVTDSSVVVLKGASSVSSYWTDLYCDELSLARGVGALQGAVNVSCANSIP